MLFIQCHQRKRLVILCFSDLLSPVFLIFAFPSSNPRDELWQVKSLFHRFLIFVIFVCLYSWFHRPNIFLPKKHPTVLAYRCLGHCGRILTTILYLNPNWQENDGGQIRLFEVGIFGWSGDPWKPPVTNLCFWRGLPGSHVFFSRLNCVFVYVFGPGNLGALNGCLENEMPWFCRCSKWQMPLPTNHQQTSETQLHL